MARWGAGVITDMDFSPDGKLIAVSSSIGIYLYDVEDDILDFWDLQVYLTSISFSRDGSMLVAGGRDSMVRVLNVENGEQIHLLKPTAHINSVQAVTFSQNGELIASGYSDGRVRIWDVANGKQLRVIEANTDLIQSLSFSPDGTRLASGSRGTQVPALRVWDISTGQEVWHLKTDNSVTKLDFSQENNLLAYAVATMSNRSTGITVVDAHNGETIKTFQGGNVVSFWEKGDLLAFRAGRSITMLDVQDWNKIHTLDHEYEVTDIVISTDGKILASFSYWNGSLILWDVESGNQLKSVKFELSRKVDDLAFYHKDNSLVSIDGLTNFLDNSGKYITTLGRGENSLTLSPNNEILAYFSSKRIAIYDMISQEQKHQLQPYPSGLLGGHLTFSPDSTLLASSGLRFIQIWDTSTWNELLKKSVNTDSKNLWFSPSLAFSSSGNLLASGLGDGEIQIWDTQSWQQATTLTGHGSYVSTLVFMSQDDILASGSFDGTVRVWNLNSAKQVHVFEGLGRITSSSISHDGKVFVCGTGDGRLYVWNTSNWQKLLEVPAHTDTISGLSFFHDGSILASSSYDGTIRLWGIEP
jgi:WD40 repeat protein